MSSIKLPSVSKGMSSDELANIVAILIKQIQWLMDGNIDSVNAREIGGWNVGQDSLMSTSGNVGFSSKVTGGDDVRMWSGNADSTVAPFRVYNSGKFVATDADITGSIHMSNGSISWGSVTAPTPQQVGALATSSPMLTYIGSTGIYTGSLTANQITAGTIAAQFISTSGLAAEKIYQVGSPSSYMIVGGNYGDLILYQSNSEFFRIYNNIGGISMKYGGITYLSTSGNSSTAYGSWSFNNASVSGLSTNAISGLEDRLKYLEDHAFILSYRSGTSIYFNSKNVSGVDSFTDAS